MAKGTKRYQAGTSVKYLYYAPHELPWGRIEAAANTSFSDDARREIYECTEAYSREFCWVEDGAPVSQTNQLREDILIHAKALCEIAERYGLFGGGDVDDIDRNILSALTILYGETPFHLREELCKTALAARRLVGGLSVEPSNPPEMTLRTSEVVGLEAFIGEALNKATAKSARNKNKNAQEYQRWNIAIGPSSKEFRQFSSAVLQQTFTENQISAAFKNGRYYAFGQYDDAYERAMNTGD